MDTKDATRLIAFAMTWLPPKFLSVDAMRLLLAIGWQESGFRHRKQVNGPAKGFWQFEKAGVSAVLNHPKSRDYAVKLAEKLHIEPATETIHAAIEFNDILAAGFARLLLWTDPRTIPDLVSQPNFSWEYYIRNWRPGAPRKERWHKAIEFALNG